MNTGSAFDFTGAFPVVRDDEDEQDPMFEGFDAKVDYWMNVRGFTREEAEQRVLTDLLDDAA